MNKNETLDAARKLINGDRAKTYGNARDNLTCTGKLWEQVFGHPVSPEQVAICMALVKIGRLCSTIGHEDSWVDGVGYLAIGSEIATETNGPAWEEDDDGLLKVSEAEAMKAHERMQAMREYERIEAERAKAEADDSDKRYNAFRVMDAMEEKYRDAVQKSSAPGGLAGNPLPDVFPT